MRILVTVPVPTAPVLQAARLLILAMALGACGTLVDGQGDGAPDAPNGPDGALRDVSPLPPSDAGVPDVARLDVTPVDTDAPSDSGSPVDSGVPVDSGPPAPRDPATVVCASDAQCLSGQTCCLYNGHCYDAAAAPGVCPTAPPGSSGTTTCYSNAQCGPSEFCNTASSGICLAEGRCDARDNCGGCSGDGCQVCGCNGVTYPNLQTACLAGTSARVPGACGTGVSTGGDAAGGPMRVGCGSNGECSAGTVCCLITGWCVDPTSPTACVFPPPGSRIACASDSDCYVGEEYCDGTGCGTPGGCVRIPPMSRCGGVLAAVCGCDGQSYANACWAEAAATRIAHTGMCP